MKLFIASDHALAAVDINNDQAESALHLSGRKSQCVAVDPFDPQLVYCGTFGSGVFRSDDGGQTWPPAGDGITHSKVLSIAVSPVESVNGRGVIYAGTEPSAIFRSDDGGDSWKECTGLSDLPSASEWSFPPRPDTHHARWIHPDLEMPGRLFVAIEAGALIQSPDRGQSWIDRVATGPIDTHQLAAHSSAPGRLFSAAGDGYFESTDSGQTWRHLEDGLTHRYVWSVAVDASDPDIRIIAAASSPRHSHDRDRAESYLFRKSGESPWQQLQSGLPSGQGRRTAILAAPPSHAGTFFTIWESDLFHSTDGGETWQQLNVQWPDDFSIGEPRGLAIAELE